MTYLGYFLFLPKPESQGLWEGGSSATVVLPFFRDTLISLPVKRRNMFPDNSTYAYILGRQLLSWALQCPVPRCQILLGLPSLQPPHNPESP